MNDNSLCPPKLTNNHICYPKENSILYEGMDFMVKWYIYDPIYHQNYSSLSLYFYYKKNYLYYKTLSFKDIGIDRGYYPLTIDNTFFPINCTENEIKWDYSLLLTGDKVDENVVLNNSLIGWIPTNFILIQNASSSCLNNTINNTSIDNSKNSSIFQNNNTENIKIEPWKIIVIVICCLLLLIVSIILIRLTYIKKMLIRKNKDFYEIEENIKNINVNKEIIYKESNKDEENTKPNEIVIYEKPNCL